jgi:phosphohistidine phosphatase SixA
MKLIAALFLSLLCISQSVLAQENDDDFGEIKVFKTRPLTQTIVEQLRQGGYVIYMRHGNTDTSRPDQIHVDFNDCATQRPLSGKGRRVVAQIGKSIRKAKIPVGDVFSSPMCRAKETARITFGKDPSVNNLLRYTANMEDKEKYQALETIRELVSKPVQGHTNRVIVAHSQNMMALIGYLPSPEGTMVIFKPKGNQQFDYIASVPPKLWDAILH